MERKNNERKMVELLESRSLRELAEADQVIAALADAFPPEKERRKAPRLRYQVRAKLELVDEDGEAFESQTLHTRDFNDSATGFVTTADLARVGRGVLHVPAPDGSGGVEKIACRVSRSNDVGNGWYEGTVEFDSKQPVFSHTKISKK